MGLTKRQSEALDLGRHVTLRAGAGSGKTHVLTERCLSLLERGAAEVRGIVTITFTEKAALEMKGRVRAGVRKKIRAAAASGDRERIRFWESVLEELPEARISTIHSFCSSLLRESPLAAGVDPDFQMLDGPAAALLLEDAIADFLDAGKEDPAYEPLRTLAVLWNRAETAGVLKTLFGSRHGALAWARATAAAPAGVIAERQCKYIREWLEDYLGGGRLENTIAELEALVCRDESDRQFAQWSAALACLREARSRAGGGLERFDFSPLASLNFTGGSKRNWGDGDLETWKLLGKQLRETGETLNKFTWSRLDDGAVVPLKALAALFLDAAAEYKARKGNGALLDFDDLQEKALEYVRKNPGAAGGGKFTHIMIDEFQDTDSLQWELARAIARGGAEAFSANVFLVGDEKQSIYGFRGADVRVFGEAADMLSAAGGGRVSLDVNFRSHPMLLEFFNETFGAVFDAPPAPGSRKIECEPMAPGRRDEAGGPPRVRIIPVPEKVEGPGFRDRHGLEAELAALCLKEMIEAGTPVHDKDAGTMRPMRIDDAAVLFRSRTHVASYEEAFRAHGLDFINVSGSGFFEAREIEDLAALLEFLADRRNEIALAAALRSPLFHLSDEELLRIAITDAGWNFYGKLKVYSAGAGAGGPAAFAAERLERWLARAGHVTVTELLADALDETGAWGVYAAGARGGQALLNINKLMDMARSSERERGGGVRAFLEYFHARREGAGGEGEALVVGVEGGGARFLTVHGAKGLEFPVAIVANIMGKYNYGSDAVFVRDVEPGRLEVGLKLRGDAAGVEEEYNTAMRNLLNETGRARQREEERRLLYVACTRARDYLVLAGHDAALVEEPPDPDKHSGCWSAELARVLHDPVAGKRLGPLVSLDARPAPETPAAAAAVECRAGEFLKELDEGTAGGRDSRDVLKYFGPPPLFQPGITVSVTDLQAFQKDPEQYRVERLLGVPAAWTAETGRRAGHARHPEVDPMVRGTAVHALFEILPSVPPGGLAARFADILMELNVPDGPEARRLAARYLPAAERFAESQLGRLVRGAGAYRELPFSLRIGPHTVTGKIDVLFETPAGWRVLDYKTDRVSPGDEDTLREEYGIQLELYALAALRGLGAGAVAAGLFLLETETATEPLVMTSFQSAAVEARFLEILNRLADFRRTATG